MNAFGTASCDLVEGVEGDQLEPVGLRAVVEVVDRFDPFRPDGMLVVASAGNRGSTRPHYPAAFDTVLSVGALDATVDGDGDPWTAPGRTAPIAAFSNRGDWVDAWTGEQAGGATG